MKRTGFVVAIVSLMFSGHISCKKPEVAELASERAPEIFYASVKPHRVTIETTNGLVSVIDVPVGVFLSVEGVDSEWDTPVRGPHTFRGDLTVRTRRDDELDSLERFGTTSDRNSSVIMSRSQFVLNLRDVKVLVETIG